MGWRHARNGLPGAPTHWAGLAAAPPSVKDTACAPPRWPQGPLAPVAPRLISPTCRTTCPAPRDACGSQTAPARRASRCCATACRVSGTRACRAWGGCHAAAAPHVGAKASALTHLSCTARGTCYWWLCRPRTTGRPAGPCHTPLDVLQLALQRDHLAACEAQLAPAQDGRAWAYVVGNVE